MTDQALLDNPPRLGPPAPFSPELAPIMPEAPVPEQGPELQFPHDAEVAIANLAQGSENPETDLAQVAEGASSNMTQEVKEAFEASKKGVAEGALNAADFEDTIRSRLEGLPPDIRSVLQSGLNEVKGATESTNLMDQKQGLARIFSKSKGFLHEHPKTKFALIGIIALLGGLFVAVKKGAKGAGSGGQGGR